MSATTQWKNGDLALVTCSDGNKRRALYHQHGGGYGIWRFHDGSSIRRVSESQARRLVAIKLPRGALGGWDVLIDALEQAKEATGYDMTFGGLIEQIQAQTRPPKPPKPDEPTGDGAVVLDARGRRWTRIAGVDTDPGPGQNSERTQASPPWRIRGANARWYDEIDAERVLFEGVPA